MCSVFTYVLHSDLKEKSLIVRAVKGLLIHYLYGIGLTASEDKPRTLITLPAGYKLGRHTFLEML